LITAPLAQITDEQLAALFWRAHWRAVGFGVACLVLFGLGTACLAGGYLEASAGFAFAGIANGYPALWFLSRARLLTQLRFGPTGPQQNEGIDR
jgi:hypothetical protein